jgi:hypothetical protein
MTTKIKGAFKNTLTKRVKVANKRTCIQKGYGDGDLRWQKIMRGALKPFQLL